MSGAPDFERVIAGGGVVLFPSDTVYGLACDPENERAIERLYALKGRPAERAAAVMFFELDAGLRAIDWLGPRTHGALHLLMPGPITALVPNPAHRYPLACRADPETLGLRIVSVSALHGVSVPVLQSSANPSGGADARTIGDVAASIRDGVDLVIDGGELPGIPSTVIDLREYEEPGVWSIRRLGAVGADQIGERLEGRFRFDPGTYAEMVRGELPEYDELQRRLVAASGEPVNRILDLGTGTGETAAALAERHPHATFTFVDENPQMLDVARGRLPDRVDDVHVALLQDPLPDGPFELVSSALAIHHLDAEEKADLFRRVHGVLAPGGRFVLGDLFVPEDSSPPRVATDGYDKPDRLSDQIRWLEQAGFAQVSVTWSDEDLAVLVALADQA